MKIIYIYVLDTLADWELGYVTAELNSRRFFKEDANQVLIKTVSYSKQPIRTMGGMTIVPDCFIDDIMVSETNMLLLPGADTWNDPKHETILVKASELLTAGATVCAICGATAALANLGILDNRPHTSNGPGFLEIVCSDYKGKDFYIDQSSIASNNLITAGSTEALLWTKQIIECLDVFKSNTLESWYNYFNTGDSKYFFELMQTLPSNNKN
ncbi:glutamine amidotransferase [Oceanobacillus oncorhynchi subsp. incaldanensis]|uniref:type 1 glutamine amidotransferase family protein n=1 Tax=Oceanobacillus oncorhynchi TaxID=545501 RepID=UPI001B10E9B3|nr:type 1 glutamine amidotransferase family protein [Oceanobacillus oncorhynchi]GIO21314.1 glutamine amidotransferase [Oceanobacillus oncorhynchi subsp. incaldanensis]